MPYSWRAGRIAGNWTPKRCRFRSFRALNAAGRLGDAKISLDLLTTGDKRKAGTIASQLESVNEERKALAAKSIEEARRQVYSLKGGRLPSLLFVESEEWLPGILGLTASNLSEEFYRPAVVVRRGEKESRASARSIPEFDIIEAIRSTSPSFLRHGGHPEAAGFTVSTEDLPRLRDELVASAEERLRDTMLVPTIEIDAVESPASLPGDRFEFMRGIGPYGKGNPAPTLLVRDARVLRAIKVGAGREHLKLQLTHGGEGVGRDRVQAGREASAERRYAGRGVHVRAQLVERADVVPANSAGLPTFGGALRGEFTLTPAISRERERG